MKGNKVFFGQTKEIQIINDELRSELLKDETYSLILELLKIEPLTLKELVDKFNSVSENRSVSRIYQYVRILEENNLIFQIGCKIHTGRNSTEKLYARTAYVYYPLKDLKLSVSHNNNPLSINILEEVLNRYVERKFKSQGEIQSFIDQVLQYGQSETREILTALDGELLEKLHALPYEELEQIVDIIQKLTYVLKPLPISIS